ncbi:hypothetical protein QK338_05350 [Acinetobacter ursingii]|uniref:hypothetical protein n=1 Tax=Acinetobacter ursingii TaxID=108980 RepID=UPI00249AC49A|nr:hypothetical protein [Acinetobacter ursingii]MDI3237542.1 hypothetical protein [Acinetobacter ursingii]
MKNPTIESFLNDVKNHELTVNLDQGVFRDITLMKPNDTSYFYNITTRPYYLMISGDMGCYVFSRTKDMFNFFRDDKNKYSINEGYWAEKIQAGEYEKYSPEAAREALNQEFENWKECIEASDEEILEEKQRLDEIDTDDYFEFMEAVRNWCPSKDGVQLNDFWEHDLNEYTYHYVWCLYAIVHAIKLYDAYQAKFEEKNHD